MNDHEFEWRRGMRELGGPVQPGRDLWLDIAAKIEAEAAAPAAPMPQRRRWALPLAAAASLAVGVLVAAQWLSSVPGAGTSAPVAQQTDPRPAFAQVNHELKQVRPQDPRLVGAAAELDSAAAELQQMLEQQPDAVFLVGLLNRTNERRMKLARMGLASS